MFNWVIIGIIENISGVEFFLKVFLYLYWIELIFENDILFWRILMICIEYLVKNLFYSYFDIYVRIKNYFKLFVIIYCNGRIGIKFIEII